jgi:DNA-binding response OmpR family regulator
MTRILIVEDHEDIASGLHDHFEHEGFSARVALTGRDGLQLLDTWHPDVMVLDLMLPDITGYDVLKGVRTSHPDLPVLILSARSDEMTKVKGFREGADDYVTKPFGLHELVARMNALLRRASRRPPAQDDVVTVGNLRIELAARRVLRDGEEVPLRPKEIELLLALVRHPNEVLSRRTLLETAWAYEPGVESRTVDWHVAELRRKLGDDAEAPHLIVTVRKAGYRWTLPFSHSARATGGAS